MQAVILAGGLGTRLGSITSQIPKGMMLVNGKPFLFHLIKYLVSNKVDDIILCTGHLGEQVSDYFGDGREFGISIRYSRETEKLMGTAGALKMAQPLLRDHFFVVNGDTYLPVDFGNIERHFVENGQKNVMVVYNNDDNTGVVSNVGLNNDMSLRKYAKGVIDADLNYVDAGVLVLKRDVLDIISTGKLCSIEEAIYKPVIGRKEIVAYITDERFYDIGTPEQLTAFTDYLKKM